MEVGKGDFMKVRILFFLFIGFALALCLSCKKRESFKGDPNAAAAKLAGLGEIMGLQFPAGTALEEYQYDAGLDDALYAKVKMPQSKLGTFFEASGFQRGTVTASGNREKPHQLSGGPKWWELELKRVTKWKASEVGLPEAEWLFILVETVLQEDAYSVYLHWFET
jgi:hypothetical protein